MVEGVGAAQTDLLLRREDELEPSVLAPTLERAACRLDHRRHGGLVVGPEDRARRVADDPVLDDRLDRSLGRHRVEVRAEEDRRALARGLETCVERAHRRADLRPGVVLVHLEAYGTQLLGDPVGDGALLTRGAGDDCQLEKEVDRRHS